MKESEDKKTNRTPPGGVEDFVANLRKFMNNPPFRGNVGRSLQENDDYSVYVSYIRAIYKLVENEVKNLPEVNNRGISLRIVNTSTKSTLTFKVFIHNGDLSQDLLKNGGKIFSFNKDIEAEAAPLYNIKIMLRDTGYGSSDIPNFYVLQDKMFAKANGKLLNATEAAESLVALYFNYLNENNITTFDNKPFTAEKLGIENMQGKIDINLKEAIKVICTDREWNLSCKANAIGILNFLGDQIRNKFTAKHPSWEGKREKNIVISEYLDPSDIFLVEEGDVDFAKNYKKICKEKFIKSNPRTLGVSLKKLKAATTQIVEQGKLPEKVFKTPNFFLIGWGELTSPKVIYMENPVGFDPENNYIISNVSITVSSSKDPESGEPGKTMYFKCKVKDKNSEKEELLFTIRKNGGENFVLEAIGSEGTESQGGKCTPLIHFVLGEEFINTLNIAIKNFESAQYELKKIAITNGKKGNTDIVENELTNIDAVLQEIQKFEKPYAVGPETVKRAAIAFAFAKKLPFSSDESVNNLVEEAFNELGYEGDVYSPKSKTPIYLGLGKDAYYSGN